MLGQKCVLRLFIVVVGALACVRGALDIEAWKGEEPLTPERIVEEMVEYFSQRDPHGIPVLEVPETIEVPDRVTTTQMTLWDIKISGHSGIRLEYVNVNLTTFSGVTRISLPWVNIAGQYTWPGWWTTSEGAANITMVGIEVVLELSLGVDDIGILMVDDLQIDMNYDDLILDFENLSAQHSIMVGAADAFFGTVIQPLIFGSAEDKVRSQLNQRLKEKLADRTFPDSIPPVDFAVAKIRRMLREEQLDPLVLGMEDVNLAWGVSVQLKNIKVSGLATIHRTHEVSAQFIDNAIFVTIQIGSQRVQGEADWSMSAALLPAVEGHLDLEVESLALTLEVKQPANIRSPPTLRKIDVQLGNVAVRSRGEGTMDYLVEVMVNVLPNALRNIIMDKLEPRIQQVIQTNLNGLDLYRIVMDQLAKKRRQEEEEQQAAENLSSFS